MSSDKISNNNIWVKKQPNKIDLKDEEKEMKNKITNVKPLNDIANNRFVKKSDFDSLV